MDSNYCSKSIIKIEGNFSLIVESESLETLGLNRLRKIVNSSVYLNTPSLCLANTINWYDHSMWYSNLYSFSIIDYGYIIKIEQQKNADECSKNVIDLYILNNYESNKIVFF